MSTADCLFTMKMGNVPDVISCYFVSIKTVLYVPITSAISLFTIKTKMYLMYRCQQLFVCLQSKLERTWCTDVIGCLLVYKQKWKRTWCTGFDQLFVCNQNWKRTWCTDVISCLFVYNQNWKCTWCTIVISCLFVVGLFEDIAPGVRFSLFMLHLESF